MERIVDELKSECHWQPDLDVQVLGLLFRDKNAFKLRLINCVEVGTRDIALWKKVASRHGYHVNWITKHEYVSLIFEKKKWNIPFYLIPLGILIAKQLVQVLL